MSILVSPADEVKKYFDANPDKFRKPESVKLSEIYLLRLARTKLL